MSMFQKLDSINIVPLDDIYKARRLATKEILNTPLVKLNHEVEGKEIYLKLENLQPVGSFKVRGGYNAIQNILENGKIPSSMITASAGNFAQGLAWAAKKSGLFCQSIVPDTAPEIKLEGLKALGADTIKVPFDDWWNVMSTGKTDIEGHFIHACCEYDCLAGNGVIGLEIVDQLEDFDSIICPYGGGSNLLGNASALKQLKPNVKCYACEVDVAAPLYTSLRKGVPSKVDGWQRTYIDGMNGKEIFPCMWKMATNLVQDSILVNTDQISSALRLMLYKNKILAEGAGAATVAAAMSEKVPEGKIVCVISGGNIDQKTLMTILNGQTP